MRRCPMYAFDPDATVSQEALIKGNDNIGQEGLR